MKVEVILKKGRPCQLVISIEGEIWRVVDAALFGFKLSLPFVDSQEELERLFAQLELRAGKVYALKRLATKDQSSMELRQKLEEKGVSSGSISAILAECTQLGYLDDKSWIERYVNLQVSKGQGPQIIVKKLMAKGIPFEMAKKGVQKLQNPQIQREKIKNLLETKFRRYRLEDPKERQKAVAALMRRGYSYAQIQENIRVDSPWTDSD